ncbi:L10-interacting MYB domain-containing protein-like [Actinidia eriantha]|uniref:L10-interacting MYB domain-containing protein-like n=1 Tax=Actinidia eriantha TaxID=165200 RepID=UPI002586CBC9|nr:L10-interacting MYB domain-containing protein-like [Actinidia eriantha]
MASRPTRSRRLPPRQQPEQQSRAKWTMPLTKILVDLMVDQVHKGNRQNHSFGKKAWKSISDDFHKKTGLKWEEQLKNRYAVLRRQYSIVKLLLDQSDFKWDETTGTIMAADEVWDRFIMEHPDAEPMRSAGCPIYKQLCTIFSEPGTNGEYKWSDEREIPCPEPLSIFKEEPLSESEDEADTDDERDKFQSTIPSGTVTRKRGRKGIDDVIANAILEMAAASKLRTAAVRQYNDRYSITDCIRLLDETQGIDEQVYFAALNLFNNPNARETFLSLKADKRWMWLCSKCSTLSCS